MILSLISFFALGASAAVLPKRNDNTQPKGNNPVIISSVDELGDQTASNTCVHRDLGFTGSLGGNHYAIFGDTMYCASGQTDEIADDYHAFNGMVRDTIARLGDNPLKIEFTQLNTDTPVPHPLQFIPYNESWGEDNTYGFGGTSLCEVDESTGAVFYLVNANDAGIKGAGIAKVELQDGNPVVTERFGDSGFWWDATISPRYGDIAAYKDPNSDYIYALGGPPTSVTDDIASQLVFQVRVHAASAFDQSQYEYWWGRGQGWKMNQPLTKFDTTTAVMWGAGQGQLYYSPKYKKYMYVHMSYNEVLIRTAPAPQGPWSADVNVYTVTPLEGGYTYAPNVHDYLDTSGDTLTIGFTNNAVRIQMIKVHFG